MNVFRILDTIKKTDDCAKNRPGHILKTKKIDVSMSFGLPSQNKLSSATVSESEVGRIQGLVT